MNRLPIVVAVTGASGAVYGRRLLEVLSYTGHEVWFTISDSATQVARQELGVILDPTQPRVEEFAPGVNVEQIRCFHEKDYFSPMASGSTRTGGMVVCPCSGGSLSAIANGSSNNLIHRAADVHLKERRSLILVQRETPLSLVHIENMRTAALAGATILPAMPAFYHGEKTIEDLVDFVVARILDQLQIEHDLSRRWGKSEVADV